MSTFAAPIAEQIWDMKYRLKQPGGEPVDRDIQGTWQRIAGALASVEPDPSAHEETFYNALTDFKFLPAGRIIAGAGADRDVTLFNCFVMATSPTSCEGKRLLSSTMMVPTNVCGVDAICDIGN